jgi:DNA ligase D-like protein (predicted polymerase)
MLIRKNTKAFKTIQEIITACQQRKDRERLVRLYITKAGHTIHDRISIESIQGEAELLYEMNYETILMNLNSPGHQLQVSDDVPGIYFFHRTSHKEWDETPFEFDETIKKEFGDLTELPFVRKKEKTEKFILPIVKPRTESPAKKEKPKPAKVTKVIEKGPRQPDFKLQHKIQFTHLDKVIFRQSKFTKEDVLNYYYKIADYILPYLKDRAYSVRLDADSASARNVNADVLFEQKAEHLPDWTKGKQSKSRKQIQLCNDREYLLLNVELGCIQFNASHARAKSSDSPDYAIITIDSPEHELTKAIDAAQVAGEILNGLKLQSYIKTDGESGLHIYLPLDSKGNFETSKTIAEYICRLVRLKCPELVSLQGTDDYTYGKVILNYQLNNQGENVIVPYSLTAGEHPIIATPLSWSEVEHGLRSEDLNHETIFKRLKQHGDPFEKLLKEKQQAETLLERLQENYSFLF